MFWADGKSLARYCICLVGKALSCFERDSFIVRQGCLKKAWEALEYLCGYERYPKMYYMYLYKSWLCNVFHEEKDQCQMTVP